MLVGMSMEWIVEYGRGREGKREGVVWWLVVEIGGWRGCEWWSMRKFLYYIGNAGLWQKWCMKNDGIFIEKLMYDKAFP